MSQAQKTGSNSGKVSVIIPFYNREEFLAEAVKSVLDQTYQNWELILVNDGSTDKSSEIAEKFIEDHPDKIFLYSHEGKENRGASSSRNLGIRKAKGDFITFLDSDDVFFSDTLEAEICAFDQNPEADVVCGTIQYWFSWAEQLRERERDFEVDFGIKTSILYQPPELLIHNLRAGGRKPGMGCVIIRSEFARKHTFFKEDFVFVSEDQLFWAKVSLYGNIFLLNKCLSKYRHHRTSSSSILVESGRMSDDWEKFLDWLENYLKDNGIENPDIWRGLRSCKKENAYRRKYGRLLSLYQRALPYFLRYRIRDFLIKWRTKTWS